jgi:hypothetical protein
MRSQLTSGSRNCLLEDGSYKQVFEGPITPSTPWLRYVYSKFDFTPVNDPGLYVIEYASDMDCEHRLAL